MLVGVYPGTFDPITAGHMDIILRSMHVVDKLIIGVAVDSYKATLFSPHERVELIKEELRTNASHINKTIEVQAFAGLLVNFARLNSANIIIRGIRAVSDFEYEFQMSCMNFKLDQSIQTVFMPASERLQLVSSKLVKEVIRLGGAVGDFVSAPILNAIKDKYQK